MNAAIRYQLEAEARRCGFDSPECVFALHEVKEWTLIQGYRLGYASIGQATRTRPGGRELIFTATGYKYRVRLLSEPLELFLHAATLQSRSFFVVGFWVEGLTDQSWEGLKGKVLALESGHPEPLLEAG